MSDEPSKRWREAAITLGAAVMFGLGLGLGIAFTTLCNAESANSALRQFQQQAVANGSAHWAHPETTWSSDRGFMWGPKPSTTPPPSAGER
jgi:hypothetical protein